MVDSQLRARGISDPRVLDAMLRVPRHHFVSEALPQPRPTKIILCPSATAKPSLSLTLLPACSISPTHAIDKVLEVGTGSGYVTALLAELAAQVFSIERHPSLADRARKVLAELGYANVRVFTGDGTLGLSAGAPFDAILVSAAASDLPPALLAQLSDSGRMIIPVGSPGSQQLQFIRMQ